MMTPVGRLLVLRASEKSDFITAMAWLQVPRQLGPVIGLPLGGFITTYTSWRWNFFVNIPIGIIGIVLGYILHQEPLPGETCRRSTALVLSFRAWPFLLSPWAQPAGT